MPTKEGRKDEDLRSPANSHYAFFLATFFRYPFFATIKEANFMELIAAMKIVKALHMGQSPETGEALPEAPSACAKMSKKPWRSLSSMSPKPQIEWAAK